MLPPVEKPTSPVCQQQLKPADSKLPLLQCYASKRQAVPTSLKASEIQERKAKPEVPSSGRGEGPERGEKIQRSPLIRASLKPVKFQRHPPAVERDTFLPKNRPLKAIHGSNRVVKLPLPAIGAQNHVADNVQSTENQTKFKVVPLAPYRPQGRAPSSSKGLRRVKAQPTLEASQRPPPPLSKLPVPQAYATTGHPLLAHLTNVEHAVEGRSSKEATVSKTHPSACRRRSGIPVLHTFTQACVKNFQMRDADSQVAVVVVMAEDCPGRRGCLKPCRPQGPPRCSSSSRAKLLPKKRVHFSSEADSVLVFERDESQCGWELELTLLKVHLVETFLKAKLQAAEQDLNQTSSSSEKKVVRDTLESYLSEIHLLKAELVDNNATADERPATPRYPELIQMELSALKLALLRNDQVEKFLKMKLAALNKKGALTKSCTDAEAAERKTNKIMRAKLLGYMGEVIMTKINLEVQSSMMEE